MALIGHDLPCRACEIAGQRRAPPGHGWSGDRDERFTASPGTHAGGLQAVRRGGGARRRGAVRRVPLAVSESGQLGARRHDPHAARTEIHDQGGVNLDADDPAQAIRIVGNLIPHGELLSRRSGGRAGEGTSGQEAPGRGAGWLHHYQYAPAGSMRLPGRSPLVPPGWPGCGRTARRAGARRYRPPAVSAHPHEPGRAATTRDAPAARDGRRVMRGRQVREARAALKTGHQVENLRPHEHGAPCTAYGLLALIAGLPVLAELAVAPRVGKDSARLGVRAPTNAYQLLITHVRSSPRRWPCQPQLAPLFSCYVAPHSVAPG